MWWRQYRPRGAMLGIVVLLSVTSVVVAGGKAYADDPATFFEIDGNGAANGGSDWSNVSALFVADASGVPETVVVPGNSLLAYPYPTKTGGANDKTDLTGAWLYGRREGDHLYLYLAASRAPKQQGQNLVDPGGDTSVIFALHANASTRSVGDLLVTMDFTNGGTTAIPGLLRWSGSQWVVVPLDSTTARAESNPAGAIGPDGSAMTANTFVEAGIDLTAAFLANSMSCSNPATLWVMTSASQSNQSTLQDMLNGGVVDLNQTGTVVSDCASVRVHKVVEGVPGSQWTMTVAPNVSSFVSATIGDGGVTPTVDIAPTVPITISEAPAGTVGYQAQWSCTNGASGSGNAFTLTLNRFDDVDCTFTNTVASTTATLTLVKTVTNDNAGTALATAWTLSATGPSTISGASGSAAVTDASVAAGTYTLAESGGPSGYTAGAWSCVKGQAAPVSGSTVTLAAGESATCTINNNDNAPGAPRLTLVKTVTNDNAGTALATAWTLSATGPSMISGASGAAAVTDASVSAGTYMLAESGGPSGYTAGAWSCVKGQAAAVSGSTITLAGGESATCTINNNDNAPAAPRLTLVKTVTNDNSGTALATAWTLSATGPSTISGVSGAAAVTDASVSAGTYTLAESGGPSGYTAGAWSCVKGQAAAVSGSTIILAAGESATCTINNNDNAPPPPGSPRLTLVKTVTNDNAGTALATAWTLSATGPSTISGASGSAAVTDASVAAGTYTLAESSGPSGYAAGAWSCVKGQAAPISGSTITLAAGESATCTINNNDSEPVPVSSPTPPVIPPPQVLGSEAAIEKTLVSIDPARVGENVSFRIVLTLTGDTDVTQVGIIDAFDPEFLQYLSASVGGCVLLPRDALVAGKASVACELGTLSPGTTGQPGTLNREVTLTFRALKSTGAGRTVDEAVASMDLDGAGPGGAVSIGPSTADVRIVQVAVLPPAGDGSMQQSGPLPAWVLAVVGLSTIMSLAYVRRWWRFAGAPA